MYACVCVGVIDLIPRSHHGQASCTVAAIVPPIEREKERECVCVFEG